MLDKSQFSYHLPKGKIANFPANPRDHSKLMFIDRKTNQISNHHFFDLPKLIDPQNTVLVLNQTKVFPARLYGHKPTGGKVEILLIRQISPNTWDTISRPRFKLGQIINFDKNLKAEVLNENQKYSKLKFNLSANDLQNKFYEIGITPLPPYIKSEEKEEKLRSQYQTVYAKNAGSSAAPTAGLHFTKDLLEKLKKLGIQIEYITLHVGPGTFQNLRPENIKTKTLHSEEYEIDEKTAINLTQAKKDGKKIISVGTTTTRCLESNVKNNKITPTHQDTNIFIYPPYEFNFIDGIITNFHLPETSLLMLVSALTSYPNANQKFTDFSNSLIGKAYQKATNENYRFYSFGDAMLIL